MRNRTTPNRKNFRSALLIRQKTNKKESIINSINKKDNNFFKRSVIVRLNNEEIKKDPQRITKTKNKKKTDWKRFEKNNGIIALNVLYAEKQICPAYVSKHNSNHDQQLILLMVPKREKRH